MPPLDIALDYQLLARVLRDPAAIDRLTPEAFGRLMDSAQRARLLGWLVGNIGPLVHILLVIAVIVLLYNLFVGGRARL